MFCNYEQNLMVSEFHAPIHLLLDQLYMYRSSTLGLVL
jgi:hypothetical protein